MGVIDCNHSGVSATVVDAKMMQAKIASRVIYGDADREDIATTRIRQNEVSRDKWRYL